MTSSSSIAIIGGGPAGLMAAEILASAGHAVTIYERKPSVGRKFLMAGRGGLNLTHSEGLETFVTRYGRAQQQIAPFIGRFTPGALQAWSEGLGQPVFTGSSGRIFPESFKASPLLRAWIGRLENLGVKFAMQRQWTGWDDSGRLEFILADGSVDHVKADATLLALGGASWPNLGSDGGWVDILRGRGVDVAPLLPSNCGFAVAWSDIFRERFAGQPVKSIALSFADQTVAGEVMVTDKGIEGGAVYALSPSLRDAVTAHGDAVMTLDLQPNLAADILAKKLNAPRGRDSFSTWLRKVMKLSPVAINLLREADRDVQNRMPDSLAGLIKAVPLRVTAPFPITRAISSAGGVTFEAIDDTLMIKTLPGIFVAGEMLDWEAPTGGYLLQATFATAQAAAQGMLKWLDGRG